MFVGAKQPEIGVMNRVRKSSILIQMVIYFVTTRNTKKAVKNILFSMPDFFAERHSNNNKERTLIKLICSLELLPSF